MNNYPVEFYDPLALALNGHKLQEFVDRLLADYNQLDITGFEWDNDLLMDFTYSQVERELHLDVMASYVDLDSPAIPVGVEGDVLGTGKIPRMKSVEYYNEDKLRKLKIRENRRDISRQSVIDAAGVGVGEIFLKLVSRHTNSISYQRDQVVSRGCFELTDANNPNGIKNVTFSNHVPTANKKSYTASSEATKRWWTNADHTTEGSSADPVKDLVAMVRVARDKNVRGHFEINDSFLDDVLGHSKVIEAIAASMFPSAAVENWAKANVTLMPRDAKVNALSQILGAPIVARSGKASVEKWNNTTKKLQYSVFDSFEKNVVVFIPDGTIGKILTVEPILLEGGEYAFAYDGKLAITVGKDYTKKCMSYNSEMTSLVVPETPRYMWYLSPCEI